MKYEIGDLVIGKVKFVKPYALFLLFDDGTEGLLHISEISDGYIKDIEKYGTVGDEIKVKILNIDPANGFLRLSYKQVPIDEMYSTHINGVRNTPVIDKSSFKELEEKLPEWIKQTIEKAKGEK